MMVFGKNIVIRTKKRKSLYLLQLFAILFCHSFILNAQDIHFTQFNATPLLTNPANTGMSGEDFRFASIYRNQWSKIGAPFETFSSSLDKKVVISNQFFAIGGAIIHDQSSSFNLTSNEFLFSVSYSKMINNHQFTFGLQPGFVSKSYNTNGITFGSQFDQSGSMFNSSLQSNEIGLNDQLSYFDLNAGVFWRTMFGSVMPSAGISVNHINMPVEKFSTASSGSRLPVRLTVNGEATLPLTSRVDLKPCFLYSFIPGAHEFLLGSFGYYAINISGIPVKKLYAVGMFRVNPPRNMDAFILGGGVKFQKLNLGFTYDLNISALSRVTNFNGAFEISLVYTGGRDNRKNISQPCYILN
jgi:type IX secretion system PorP/SprF family membrane protein